MVSSTLVAKVILIVINLVIILFGLVLFILGLVIHSQPAFSQALFPDMVTSLQKATEDAGVKVKFIEFSLAQAVSSLALALVVVGLFLISVSLLGLFGILCNFFTRLILILYFIITLVLFLVQLILVIYAVSDRDSFRDVVEPGLKTNIRESYQGIASNDSTSLMWNGIMMQLQCCGVKDYTDFKEASRWKKTIKNIPYDLVTPVACCKKSGNPLHLRYSTY